jgi:hypothetical protein
MEVTDGLECGIARGETAFAFGVFGGGAEVVEIFFDDVFDAEKDVAESSFAHQGREAVTVVCDGGGHGLNVKIDVIETSADDRLADFFETRDVEHDVVVHDEDGSRAVALGIADIFDDSFDRKNMKISAAHFNDRTEAAIKRATARGFDHVDGPANHGVALQHPCRAIRQADLVLFEALSRGGRIVNELLPSAEGEAGNGFEIATVFKGAQQLSKGRLTFSANHKVDERPIVIGIFIRRETGVVSAKHDSDAWSQASEDFDDLDRRVTLKGHHR